MKFLRTLRFWARVIGFGIATIIGSLLMEAAGLLFRTPRIELINIWVPRWSRWSLGIFGVKVQRHGPHVEAGELYPQQGANGIGRIFVANHSSGLDIPVIFTVAEAHCISRHDVASWPFIGRRAKRVGTLFVDRRSRKSGAGVLKEVEQALARGEGVAMFPEGTVGPGDELLPFRNGAFKAALRAGAEIVPIGIAYGDARAYYGKLKFMEHIRNIGQERNLQVAVEVGEPILCEGGTSIEIKELARGQVQTLFDRARARLNT